MNDVFKVEGVVKGMKITTKGVSLTLTITCGEKYHNIKPESQIVVQRPLPVGP